MVNDLGPHIIASPLNGEGLELEKIFGLLGFKV